jgi:hypothetical protein
VASACVESNKAPEEHRIGDKVKQLSFVDVLRPALKHFGNKSKLTFASSDGKKLRRDYAIRGSAQQSQRLLARWILVKF